MSHCSDCGRNLSESGGGDCETCSGVCEPKEPTLADVDVIEVINTLPTMTEFECGYNECAGRLQAVIESEQPGKPLAKRLQEIIDLPVRTEYDRGYQACESRCHYLGLPSADEIAGRHVHVGRKVAIANCHPEVIVDLNTPSA